MEASRCAAEPANRWEDESANPWALVVPANPWALVVPTRPAANASGRRKETAAHSDADTAWASKKLRKAVNAGNISQLREMLAYGVNINAGDGEGKTALHYAARQGLREMSSLLLEAQADPNAEDRWGGRPVDEAEHWAIKPCRIGDDGSLRIGCLETLEVLREYGGTRSDPEQRNDKFMFLQRRAELERIAEVRRIEVPWRIPDHLALPPIPVASALQPAVPPSALQPAGVWI